MTVRVLLVDDQPLLRLGFRMVLESEADLEVVGEASDGAQAASMTAALAPDVVLMDVRMPVVDGIEATRRIVAANPSTNVLMLTTFAEDDNVYGALAAGAVGFLVKDGEPTEMIEAVRRAARGEPLLAPSVLARVVERAQRAHLADSQGTGRQADRAVLATLTAREREVLSLVGAGRSNAEIAKDLHVGVTTVKTHIVALLDKLGVRKRIQAGIVAHRLGLIDDEFRPLGAD